MAPSNTFFEQVPVETVKKIAKEFPEQNAIASDGGTTEVPAISSPRENWREVAQQVQQEQDPKRVTELVQHLIALLDQEKLRKGPAA